MIVYLLLALTAMYAASIAYGNDRYEALNGLLRTAMLIPLYVIARSAASQPMQRIWTAWVWLTGLSVPIGAAANRYVDGRLAGFIDYANGYAILLLIGIIMSVALSVRGVSGSKWLQIPIFLCTAGIYLTESRTVLALSFAAFAMMFFWSRGSIRLLWLRSFANAAMGLAVAGAFDGSALLMLPVLAVFVLGFRLSDLTLSSRYARLTLLAAGLVVVFLALYFGPGIIERWSTIGSRTGEGFTRLDYYRDAWSMVADSPVWGFGAGAWNYLQYQYQSASYFTAYIHSQPLQLMVEVGISGFLIFAAACVWLVIRGFAAAKHKVGIEAKYDQLRLLACCALLLHSLVDFSLSFPYLLGLLFILGASPSSAAATVVKSGASFTVKGIVSLIAAGMLIIAAFLLTSEQLQLSAERAIAENRKADAIHLLNRSASAAIFSDRIHDRIARLYLREYESSRDRRYLEVAVSENEKALSLYPEQIWYRKLKSDLLWMQGSREASITVLSELVEQNRFIARWREELGQRKAKLKE
ncbi:O-antigen ligase [Paenibacillus sp. R14(2021)]|uniref:O-antigen ligase family protein n=1 Tax=Paenibacillus sp. R14(2021) TaxID=2859228 RepID=UPI001C61669D|nr:O-antigen ligase family protein [Paenibacillus sp. R14(2021)]